MKIRHYYSILLYVFFMLLIHIPIVNALDFYVSPDGSDGWSGRLSEPNALKSDGPFASMERARDAIRAYKSEHDIPADGITVWFRGGNYYVSDTLTLTGEDSGEEDRPVVWRAYNGETVRFLGGKDITSWEAVADQDIADRLNEECKDSIVQIDLAAQGFTDIPGITTSGPAMEVFFQDERMIPARYPNDDYMTIRDVPMTGDVRYEARAADHYGKIHYTDIRPRDWARYENIWMFGYWYYNWSDSYQEVDTIDTAESIIYMKQPFHYYGYRAGQRFYFLNVLEELDSPGEWYLDIDNGMLYFYPPSDIGEDDMYISVLTKPMISLNEASHVMFRDLNFEGSSSNVITIDDGTDNTIAGCVFRNILEEPVSIDGGTNNGLTGCDLYNLGAGGVLLNGGDRKTLTPAHNYVINCYIHHFGIVNGTYRPAVKITGVGNIVSHCHFHDSPHQALQFTGNEHRIEYNEIHTVAQETGDVGAFYTLRNWTMRGTVVRYNFFYDISGMGTHKAMAVYLDDAASGTTIFGNVFHDVYWGAYIGGGRDNIVDNNVFVNCVYGIHMDGRGLGWAVENIAPGGSWDMYQKLDYVNHDEPPYSERYPKLATILDEAPDEPRGNSITTNICYESGWAHITDSVPDPFPYLTMENNWTEGDPGFIDAGNMDLRLRADSPAFDMGFEAIPIEDIGLYVDQYRAEAASLIPVSVIEEDEPEPFQLRGAFPNPFNPSTTISFTLDKGLPVHLAVYSITGQKIAELVDDDLAQGTHSVVWNGKDSAGVSVSSGVYLIQLKAGHAATYGKMTMLK